MEFEKLEPEFKAKWVAALRSGKYLQGKGELKSGNYYCCLGVAGRYNIKSKTYIDAANSLLKALNRNAESMTKDAHLYFKGIQNNNIICFDGDTNSFKRCVVDFEFHEYNCIKSVDIDVLQFLT